MTTQTPSVWIDRSLGIPATTEAERGLLKERFVALTKQLPWMYLVLFANILIFHLGLAGEIKISGIPAGILLFILALRGWHWFIMRSQDMRLPQIIREMRKTFLTTAFFCVGGAVLAIALYVSIESHHHIDVVVFASIVALGFAYGLSSFPVAARIPVLVISLPLAILLTATPQSSYIGMGISLILVSCVTLRLISIQEQTFSRLVSSRFTIEIEKRRAEEAEKLARSEQSRVATIANTDFLTGLVNRRGFLAALRPREGGTMLALILLDLDSFKPINDTFGHTAGDELLVEVSRRLRAFEKRPGSVARLGGDEFGILLEGGSTEEAMTVARQAVDELSKPFLIKGRTTTISACAGLSFQARDDLSEGMRQADLALYAAKDKGRGSVAIFSQEMESRVLRQTSIEQALRAPGLPQSVELAYQPIFRLDTMELQAFEALARWQHSELGWISPAEFIPLTEQISIVDALSDSMLRRAAAAALHWPSTVRLSFNLSAVQLCSVGTAGRLLKIISDVGLDPSRLQIEVTETAFLADFDIARRNLAVLRRAGVRIVLDDFGAGYASISYLREMNFDEIKLDGSLIKSSTRPGNGLSLLQGVLALCRAMKQDCVAEQIETDAQLSLLRRLGCQFGQGFALARPMAFDEAVKMATLQKSNAA